MDRKKLAAMALLIAIALSMFGFVYSAWTDYVTIDGTVNMGSLTLAFDYKEPPECHEYYLDHETGQLIPGEYEGKDVGRVGHGHSECVVRQAQRHDLEPAGH